jgi:pimeloyl-ACP methyl ester carboxylesterase
MIPDGLFVDDLRAGGDDRMPVVLVHGAPDRSRTYAKVTALLSDLPLIVYDRRGYGRSLDAVPAARSFADHADDLIALLDGRRATIVAQSVGANVALTAASRAPHLVAALGLWEPPIAWADWWPDATLRRAASSFAAAVDTGAMIEGFAREHLGAARWEGLAPTTRTLLLAEGAAFKVDMASELSAPFAFEDVRAPTVIGYGTATSNGHAEGARRLAARMGAELYAVEGAGHFASAAHPEAFARLARLAVGLATASSDQ